MGGDPNSYQKCIASVVSASSIATRWGGARGPCICGSVNEFMVHHLLILHLSCNQNEFNTHTPYLFLLSPFIFFIFFFPTLCVYINKAAQTHQPSSLPLTTSPFIFSLCMRIENWELRIERGRERKRVLGLLISSPTESKLLLLSF